MSDRVNQAIRRIAVLVSGSGSNLQALIDAIESHELPNVEIALVVSNKANAIGLQRALIHKIPTLYLPWSWTRQEVETKLAAVFALFQIELIVLAGWMRIFTPDFIAQYPKRIINLHPALLPDDGEGNTFTTSHGSVVPVLRGLHVVKRALESGMRVTGSTVHYVTPEVDAGPMICRQEVYIEDSDTEETLHERIKQVEHQLIIQAVKSIS
ncbi:MAG: phosphoribosylglycinamide formyltransferase [Ktedonobacteraceae bacterium]